ncbi:hypothetical protein [Ideonella sp.]|uniref:hypothetical protein n=1 Tax=Ideonella sp. TaxID=1929293 RepID=UPI003BB7530C
MLLFRSLLVVMAVSVLAYTGLVLARQGTDFLSVFFGDIAGMSWAGQFNLDFMGMLVLSASWVAWRHCFSAGGIALAALALVGGTPFLCIYLLVEMARHGGDVRAVLLGQRQGRR